ncbi:MAG: cysteine synthase A [Elusimicrobia bacterium]|nr:cysteine synthase A [Elusimicrobiota bacterium]
MGGILNKIYEAVGNTPLVKLDAISRGLPGTILGKVESFNPLGSIKDRIGLAMIQKAEAEGLIDEKTTVIEPTSGNTGIALAFICAAKGYKLVLTMPETMSMERRKLLKALGARLILTPGTEGMRGAIERAAREAGDMKNSYIPQQFDNPANPDIHRKTTAREIWKDTGGRADILVSGVGTGGTITGVSEALKEKNPYFYSVAVEPEESPVLSGGEPGTHRIQGIGAGFVPKVLNTKIIDEIVKISSDEALEGSRRIAKEEGIFCGISSGAAIQAACRIAKREESRGKIIIVILPDLGDRYLSLENF